MNTTLHRSDSLEVFLGVLLAWGMNVLASITGIFIILFTNTLSTLGGLVQMLSSPVTYFLILALLLFGLTQFVYIIPLSAWLQDQQKVSLQKGLIVGSMLTVLLNGGCLLWLGLLLR